MYPVDGAAFPLGIGSPEHEDKAVQVLVEPGHHDICELLPAPLLVGRGLVSPNREHRVEQEHSWQTKHIQGLKQRVHPSLGCPRPGWKEL